MADRSESFRNASLAFGARVGLAHQDAIHFFLAAAHRVEYYDFLIENSFFAFMMMFFLKMVPKCDSFSGGFGDR